MFNQILDPIEYRIQNPFFNLVPRYPYVNFSFYGQFSLGFLLLQLVRLVFFRSGRAKTLKRRMDSQNR